MKKMLLILLVLAFAVPAWAEVIVFNWKTKESGYDYYNSIIYLWKGSYKGYLVIEESGGVAYATFIEIWTEKWSGGTDKLMDDWDEEYDVVEADIGNNKTIIILSTGDDEYRVLLTGAVKKDIVSKFTGTEIWDEEYGSGNRDIGIANWTLSFNKKWTAAVEGMDFNGAYNFVVGELSSQGYVWD
ncbi:MAG: hypothetical protein JW749_04005 [Sedimentisphaerales bacterium]|nr:hypothetical protein [Sedimentisphaerales bacterium]